MFSNAIVQQAWTRSGGRCECADRGHQHMGRCNRALVWEWRTSESKPGAWVADSKSGNFMATANDCEITCWHCYSSANNPKH